MPDSEIACRGFNPHERSGIRPGAGRFLSVDPVFQAPTNGQSLNPYSYVRNNPLSLTDPTGYIWLGESPADTTSNFDGVNSGENKPIKWTDIAAHLPNFMSCSGNCTFLAHIGNGQQNGQETPSSPQTRPNTAPAIGDPKSQSQSGTGPAGLATGQSSGQQDISALGGPTDQTASSGNIPVASTGQNPAAASSNSKDPFDMDLLNPKTDSKTYADAMTYVRTPETQKYYIVIGHGDLLQGQYVIDENHNNVQLDATSLAERIVEDPKFLSNPRPIMLMICMGAMNYDALARNVALTLHYSHDLNVHVEEPVSGPTEKGLIGNHVYSVSDHGYQRWFDSNGHAMNSPP